MESIHAWQTSPALADRMDVSPSYVRRIADTDTEYEGLRVESRPVTDDDDVHHKTRELYRVVKDVIVDAEPRQASRELAAPESREDLLAELAGAEAKIDELETKLSGQTHFDGAAELSATQEALKKCEAEVERQREMREEVKTKNARLKERLAVGDDNREDARTALAMLREAIEAHAKPGSVTAGEYVMPEATAEAEALIEGVLAIAGERDEALADAANKRECFDAELESHRKQSKWNYKNYQEEIEGLKADRDEARTAFDKQHQLINGLGADLTAARQERDEFGALLDRVAATAGTDNYEAAVDQIEDSYREGFCPAKLLREDRERVFDLEEQLSQAISANLNHLPMGGQTIEFPGTFKVFDAAWHVVLTLLQDDCQRDEHMDAIRGLAEALRDSHRGAA